MSERTITISAEDAEAIDRLVEAGTVGSAAEVVGLGVRAASGRDVDPGPGFDRWLNETVAPRIERRRSDPQPDLTVEQVRARFAGRAKPVADRT